MLRRSLVSGVALIVALLAIGVNVVLASPGPAVDAVDIRVPRSVEPGTPFVVTLTLPGRVTAVDGRVLMDRRGLEVWGIAPLGGGSAFRPEPVAGGVAFGAYDLRPHDGQTVVRLVMAARRPGRSELRVIVDAMADRGGSRMAGRATDRLATISAGGSTASRRVPVSPWDAAPRRAAGPTRDLLPDGRIDKQDVDAARIGWIAARLDGRACGGVPEGDANGDGCVDIVDVQAVRSARRMQLMTAATVPAITAVAPGDRTFTVTSAADTPDATPGDAACADSSGRCTLRAAMTESSWINGNDRIDFALPGIAPVTIQLASRLPNIGSRNGTLTIDGYTQAGSRVNTAPVGSNAVPGVEIRGNGNAAGEIGLYITSMGNTVRGVTLNNIRRAVLLDGPDAHHNRFVGNWVGFNKDGTLPPRLQYGVLLNYGAHDNTIGTPDPADRNLIGNYGTAIDHFGTGVQRNVLRNNVLCLRPTGLLVATCNTAIDYNFGPKDNVIGGSAPNERNVVGPTFLQGIEWSHGWDPAGPGGQTDATWEISGNSAIGNWVGFRGDGSYNASFRSGLNASSADNANAINAYDGARRNVIEGNFVASVYDGIIVMCGNAEGNVIRNNVVGVSPLGQPAPLTRWGIIARLNTKQNIIEGNIIRNAGAGGVGLLDRVNSGSLAAVAQRIRISRNIVSDTTGPAILLAPDPYDPTSTANGGIAKPVFTSATVSRIEGTAVANGRVELYRASRPVGQSGLPIEFLGAATVGPDGTWNLPLALSVGDTITALQIAPNDDTSELAPNVAVQGGTPPPRPGDLLASDDFERTVNSGWGDAVKGGRWSLIGDAAEFSVSAGAGRMRIAAGATREARLNLAVADVDMTGHVSFDRLPAAGNVFAYVIARANGNSMYRITIRVSPAGLVYIKPTRVMDSVQSDLAAEVDTRLSTNASAPMAFHLRMSGGHMQFRVWDARATEPTAWSFEIDDATPSLAGAGAVGLKAYAATSVPNGPVSALFDALEVRVP
jgi:CSLREA domain-containing protein